MPETDVIESCLQSTPDRVEAFGKKSSTEDFVQHFVIVGDFGKSSNLELELFHNLFAR